MLSKRKIVYTGAFRFPCGDAASQRVLNNAKIFRCLGFEVEFVSWGGSPRKEDERDGYYYYQGFKYYNTNDIDNKGNLLFTARLDSFFRRGKNSLGFIKEIIKDTAIIIAYNPSAYFTCKLLSMCKKNNVIFISDITEWYAANEIPGGKFAPPYWISEFNMRSVQKQVKNKILISSYLNEFYSESNNIVLPPLIDSTEEKWTGNNEVLAHYKGLRIIYAGTPAQKDRLETILEAVVACLMEGVNIQFCVIGVTQEEIKHYKCFKKIASLTNNIKLIGRIPQQEVPAYYRVSDFSVLVRENNRKNRAGFPTKFAESLMAGCPVIVNETSDVLKYVKTNINGIILSNHSVTSVKKGLISAAGLNTKKIDNMKANALAIAIEKFDYERYVNQMSSFIDKLNK